MTYPSQTKEARALYRKTHRKQIDVYRAKWLAKQDPDWIKNYNAKYEAANKERHSIRDKAYRRVPENRMKLQVYHANLAAKKFGIDTELTYEDICTLVADNPMLCVYCSDDTIEAVWQIDHVMPMSKGGTNTVKNLAISCMTCNSGKCDTLVEEYLTKKGN